MRSFRKMQFSICSHSKAYFLKCRVFLCCFIITAPGVLYWVSKNEDHTIHKPISRMVAQGQGKNPLLQDSLQLYAPYSRHFSWSSPRLFTACFSAQPCSACCSLSPLCNESCKSWIKEKITIFNSLLSTLSFLPAFHSPSILPPGKLIWLAISLLWYCLDYLWALRTQETISLIWVTSSATDK